MQIAKSCQRMDYDLFQHHGIYTLKNVYKQTFDKLSNVVFIGTPRNG